MSSEKLTELTAEMKAKMPFYLDKYTQIGRDTREADWATAEDVIRQFYRFADLPVPDRFYRCRNPVLAAQAGDVLAKELDGVGGKHLFSAASVASGAARFDFLVNGCGVKIPVVDRQEALSIFVASCGGFYPHTKFAIIYDRPSILKIQVTNGQGVLHCEDGPALAWGRGEDGQYSPEDIYGLALYYWQGTRVPDAWITDKPGDDPVKLKARAAEILAHPNQEVLRAGCEIVGWVPVLEALGMRVIDEHPEPHFGRLVEVDLPNAPNARFLVAQCGTGRTIAVPADPEATTALEAGALSYNVPVELYARLPPTGRT